MKVATLLSLLILLTSVCYAADPLEQFQQQNPGYVVGSHDHGGPDPWGLSEYVSVRSSNSRTGSISNSERRLTNSQAVFYKQLGLIDDKGDITGMGAGVVEHRPLPKPQAIATQTGTVASNHPDSKGTVTVRPTAPHPTVAPGASQAEVDAMHRDVAMMLP
ncbi:MAG: hypothetical protein QNK31_10415 [Porticoccus sp.]|nr:hypothetical protein [Porticoccus sp.]